MKRVIISPRCLNNCVSTNHADAVDRLLIYEDEKEHCNCTSNSNRN